MTFDPADDHPDGFFTTKYSTDGVVEIVAVEREIDVAGFDKEGKSLFRAGGQDGKCRFSQSERVSAVRFDRPLCMSLRREPVLHC